MFYSCREKVKIIFKCWRWFGVRNGCSTLYTENFKDMKDVYVYRGEINASYLLVLKNAHETMTSNLLFGLVLVLTICNEGTLLFDIEVNIPLALNLV